MINAALGHIPAGRARTAPRRYRSATRGRRQAPAARAQRNGVPIGGAVVGGGEQEGGLERGQGDQTPARESVRERLITHDEYLAVYGSRGAFGAARHGAMRAHARVAGVTCYVLVRAI